jgi:hypothetical protein
VRLDQPSQSKRSIQLVVGSERRDLSIGACRPDWDRELLPGESWEDREFLDEIVKRPLMMNRLRGLLAVFGTPVPDGVSDDEVVNTVVLLVQRRELCLSRNPFGRLPWPAPNVASLAPSREAAPQQRAVVPASVPSVSAAPAQEQLIDQDRQAETLRRAAQEGAPFCEACAEAGQQRAA